MIKLPFIFNPKLRDIFPVLIVEAFLKWLYLLIIENAVAVKLVLLPVTFICDLVVWVIENSFAAHFVLFPLSNVLAAFLVVKSALTMTQIVELLPLILPFLVGLLNILKLRALGLAF
jgi:hypothetical protein